MAVFPSCLQYSHERVPLDTAEAAVGRLGLEEELFLKGPGLLDDVPEVFVDALDDEDLQRRHLQ